MTWIISGKYLQTWSVAMRARKSMAVALGLICLGMGLVSPANAAQVGSITATNGTASGGQVCHNNQGGSSYSIAPSGGSSVAGLYTFSGSGSDTVRVTNNCAATGGDTVGTMYVGQSGIFTQVAPGNYVDVLLSGGNFGLYGSNVSGNLIRSFAIQVTGGGTNNNGGTASAQAAAPEPVFETLSLSVEANGASCTGGNPTGPSGTWLALPKADDCKQTGPNGKAGAKLLGWSPNANFPVEVAQNQIARGWGVYDGPIGGVRMIFIPAGMSTFVSGSNTLYPVWSA